MPDQSNNARRVTGSADIPLAPEGREQAQQMAQKYSFPFDAVFCGPEQRAVETARNFGNPVVLRGLDAWYRGAFEGRPSDKVKDQMRYFMTHPDVRPPGRSPVSGKRGETYNEFLRPLLRLIVHIRRLAPANQRILIVTSGGNLQAIAQFAKQRFPKDMRLNLKALSKVAYWTATGELFRLTNTALDKVSENKEYGVYLCEHAATANNPLGAQKRPA